MCLIYLIVENGLLLDKNIIPISQTFCYLHIVAHLTLQAHISN
ncbi:Uncharacterised protein [Segatella copri]|nr:Uncharacterised protein [Segatella copri]